DPVLGIDNALLEQGKAEGLGHAADDLAVHHHWVDDAPAIVGRDHPQHGHFAGFEVDFDLDALRAKGTHRFVLWVWPARAVPLNHMGRDALHHLGHADLLAWRVDHFDLAF